jgi:hypothetical protein
MYNWVLLGFSNLFDMEGNWITFEQMMSQKYHDILWKVKIVWKFQPRIQSYYSYLSTLIDHSLIPEFIKRQVLIRRAGLEAERGKTGTWSTSRCKPFESLPYVPYLLLWSQDSNYKFKFNYNHQIRFRRLVNLKHYRVGVAYLEQFWDIFVFIE